MLDFEKGFTEIGNIQYSGPKLTRPRGSARFRSRVLRPTRWGDDDSEMGIFPLLAAAIPAVTSLAGSLLSKRSKKGGGPPPEAAQAQNVLDLLTKAIGGDEKKGETSIKDVIRNIVRTVPPPVIGQVKNAINEMKNAQKAGIVARENIVRSVDSKFGPKIHALLAGLKASEVQKQATYEHNRLKRKAAFRGQVKRDLRAINNRLDAISRRLDRSAIVQGQTRIDLLGGRNLLEKGARP